MRRLLNKQANKSFSTLKNIIVSKTKEIKEYESIRGLEFEKHLKQIMLDRKSRSATSKQFKVTYDKICLTAPKPIETLLNEFIQHSKSYDENDLVQTTLYMANAFQISLHDHGGHLDRFNHKLLESPIFDHFIEEVKYALSDKAFTEIPNVVKILNALGRINYVDLEIIRLVMVKIEKILNLSKEETISFEPRAYQSEKKDYYKSGIIGLDKQLLESEIFQKNIAYFQEKKKEYAEKLSFSNVQKSDLEESYQFVVGLIDQFEKFNKGTQKFIEGIIAVRQQYRKLVVISENQKAMRNPELNSASLLLEEKLLQMGLISIEDIKNPELILDETKEYERVEQIVKMLMSSSHVGNFQEFFVTEPKNFEYLKTMKQKELSNLSALLEALAQYANLPYKLQGTDDKISLLNVKWQRFFLENKFQENNLSVERMFRKAFAETQRFIQRNLSILELSLIQGTFQSKVRYYSALVDLGFLEQVANELKGVKVRLEEVKKLNDSQFLVYLKILNNLYQNDVKPIEHDLKYIQKRLSDILERNDYIFSINELCETINFLYQSSAGKQSEVYQKLIIKLSQQVKYIERSFSTNKQLTRQAKRILFFVEPENEAFQSSLFQLNKIDNFSDEKGNPYLKAIYDTLSIDSANMNSPFIPTGINSNNEISGIYLTDSNSSSIEGNYVSGNINAYCMRLYHKYGVKVFPVGINKFIDFKAEKQLDLTDSFTIKMKTPDEIFTALGPYLARNNQMMTDFLKDIGSYLIHIANMSQNNFKIKKILIRLKRLATLYKSEKDITLIDQFYAKRCQVLVQFNLLKRDLELLTSQQLQSAYQKLFSNEESKSLSAILSRVEAELEKPLPKIQERLNELEGKEKGKQSFIGKRITLNLLDENSNDTSGLTGQNLQIELLSLPYLLDFRYADYEDWSKRIKQTVNVNEIKLENASELTKLLIMKFCPQIKETIVALPEKHGEFFVPYFPVNWQKKYHYYTENQQQKDYLEKIAEAYRAAQSQGKDKFDGNLIALQNFKHELKVSCSPKQILQNVLELDCLKKLMLSRLSQKADESTEETGEFIKRDARQYFNYLQRKCDKTYLESPYLEYIFNKIEQSENMKLKVKERKENKIKLQMLYNQGVINKKQYFENLKDVDNKLIDQLKKLKKKVLSHIQGVQILEDPSKIVQLNKNIDDLSRIVSSAEYYDQAEDSDLASVGGDYEKALQIKRSKAETQLILYRILALKAKNKKITKEQQEFLSKWKDSVKNGISSFNSDNRYTKLPVSKFFTNKDVSNNFQPTKNLVKAAPTLAASDVLLELALFFDESVLHQLESQIYGEHFSQKYKVPASVFQASSNKVFKHLTYKAEDAIFEKNSQLSQKQVDCLIQMTKIFKTEAVSDNEKYKLHYSNFRENLELINKCRYRNPLSIEYLKQKDSEYYYNYVPSDVADIKNKEVSDLWKKLFKKDQKQTNSAQIRQKVDEICKRMLFIKMSTPPYFGNLVLEILQHERTDTFTKQKLIAFTELFKVPLQIDSADLEKLIQPENIQFDAIMDEMRKASGRNFSKSLYASL